MSSLCTIVTNCSWSKPLPSALQIRQKARVKQTNAQFHSWFFPTVDTPMKMKIRVSLTLLSIFMKYLMVV